MQNLRGGHVAAPVIHRPKIKERAKALSVKFNPDRLSMVSRNEAAIGAFGMLDKVQDEMPELAVASVSLLFATLINRLGLSPYSMYEMGNKMLQHVPHEAKANAQIDGMIDLAKEQWQGKPL